MPQIAISSTLLRDRVRAKEPIRFYVPDPVINYIDHHNLYAGVRSFT
jgi:nicotinate-nucleotide adenylyltransferase